MVQEVSRETDGICIIYHWFQFPWSKSHFREAWKPGGPWVIGCLSSLSYVFFAQGWCKGASFHPWMSLINSPSPAPSLLLSTTLSNWLRPWLTVLKSNHLSPRLVWAFVTGALAALSASAAGFPTSWSSRVLVGTVTGVLQKGDPWPDGLKWMPCSFFSHWRARHMIASVFTDVQLCWAQLQLFDFAHQNAMCGKL